MEPVASLVFVLIVVSAILLIIIVAGTLPSGREETENRDNILHHADTALAEAAAYLTPCVVIDTCIWMTEGYGLFFDTLDVLCRRANYRLMLFGPQFDEITSIKRLTAYEDRANVCARLAIDRIERLQKGGLLAITPVSIGTAPGADADPLIVELLSSQAERGVPCTFVSEDKELRIRVRQHLSNCAKAPWTIVEIDEFMPKCRTIVESLKYRPKDWLNETGALGKPPASPEP